jgi:hypothetical protein
MVSRYPHKIPCLKESIYDGAAGGSGGSNKQNLRFHHHVVYDQFHGNLMITQVDREAPDARKAKEKFAVSWATKPRTAA